MRSLAQQTVEELGGRWSILHRQKQDHVKLDWMLVRLTDSSGDDRGALLNEICRLVFTHTFAEEAVLWPALRRSLDGGEERPPASSASTRRSPSRWLPSNTPPSTIRRGHS